MKKYTFEEMNDIIKSAPNEDLRVPLQVRINRPTKYTLGLIAKEQDVSMSQVCRAAICTMSKSFPAKHYEKMIRQKETFGKGSDIKIAITVSASMAALINKRRDQIGATRQDLMNLILTMFIREYLASRPE